MALYGYVEGRSDGVGVPDTVILRCDCVGRCELEVEKQKGDYYIKVSADGKEAEKAPDEYFITFKLKARDNTLNIFEALKLKLKKIWYVIRGKDYLYYDIEVDANAMKQYVEALNKMVNE